MKIVVAGHSKVTPADLSGFALPPAWRKATRNMILASLAARKALGSLAEKIAGDTGDVGLLIHTRSGELETSADFLKTWMESKLARPLLFQNSLHNATAGFISIEFQLRGPAFTLSTASEDGLFLAKSLIESGVCSGCLVVSVEVHRKMADLIQQNDLPEGAAAVMLVTEEAAKKLGAPILANLGDFKISTASSDEKTPLLDFNHDALARWCAELGAQS